MVNIKDIVDGIKFRDWNFVLEDRGDCLTLQVQFMAPCNVEGGKPQLQHCRKWFFSKHVCENEVVRTAWKAIEAAVVHEAAEQFTFLGQRVFDPHVDFTKLAEFMKSEPLDMRD